MNKFLYFLSGCATMTAIFNFILGSPIWGILMILVAVMDIIVVKTKLD